MPSRARWVRIRATQARSSSSERTFASESIGCRWVTFSSRDDRRAADPLRRRVGRDELGMRGLEGDELAVERVVVLVADLGVVLDVVALRVVGERRAQLGGAGRGSAGSLTSRAAARGRAASARRCPGGR